MEKRDRLVAIRRRELLDAIEEAGMMKPSEDLVRVIAYLLHQADQGEWWMSEWVLNNVLEVLYESR